MGRSSGAWVVSKCIELKEVLVVKVLFRTGAVIVLGLLIHCGVVAQTPPKTQSVKTEPAPQIDIHSRFRSLDSTPIRLADYPGKVVVLVLWASWCVPCQEAINGLVDLQREFADRGVQVIALSIEDSRAADPVVRRFVARFPTNYRVGWISTISADKLMTRKNVVPQIFVVQDGAVLKTFVGWHPTNTMVELRQVLDAAQKRKTTG